MTKDMTSGSPLKLIVGFSIPLLFGFLFQQLYSMVDTIIVGRYLGKYDLAAVGATGPVSFLIIGFCMGICSGFAIPVSHKFGAGDESGLRRIVANCIWMSAFFAVVMTILTTIFCRPILEMMRTPDDIIDGSYAYIWVIFLGIPVTFLYNMTAGIIRALGDSKTPVIFLVMSSFLNIGLDLFFIINLDWGVRGAACATVISQGISGLCCLIFMIKKFEILRIRKNEWAPDRHLITQLFTMGVPMGLQYSITAIGSVILQSATNTLGSDAVAAVTAGGRINGLLFGPFDAMGSTMATYGGQNVGAGKLDRLDKGMKDCIIIGAVYSVIALLVAIFLGKPLATVFLDVSEMAIINNVRLFLICNTAFFFLLALVNIVRFMIQGMGFSGFAVLAGVLEMIARSLTAFILVPRIGFLGSCLGSPIAWLFADAFLIPAYFHVKKILQKRQAQQAL